MLLDIVTVMATTTDAHDGTGLRLYMSNFQRPDLAVIPDATVTVAIQGSSARAVLGAALTLLMLRVV
jgi:hypothetical protein